MNRLKYGIDCLIENPPFYLKGSRLGLVTNHTGVTSDFTSTIDALDDSPHYELTSLFACEHGIRGDLAAGALVESSVDEKTMLPIYSLYNKSKKISFEMLEQVDIVLFDIQDVGVRYYTYLATLKNVIEACELQHKKVVVLDRPNPIASKIDGNILQTPFTSFVGPTEMPICTGLTIGEYANFLKGEMYKSADVEVIPLEGWKRDTWYDDLNKPWIPPSPNIPQVLTTIAYPITCYLEGTNLSEGRGTTKPFEWFGAPWLKNEETIQHLRNKNLDGVEWLPVYFTPSSSKHEGVLCSGIQLLILDRNRIKMIEIGYEILHSLFEVNTNDFNWLAPFKEGMPPFIDLLWGTNRVRKAIQHGHRFSFFEKGWTDECRKWRKKISPYKIYEKENF